MFRKYHTVVSFRKNGPQVVSNFVVIIEELLAIYKNKNHRILTGRNIAITFVCSS